MAKTLESETEAEQNGFEYNMNVTVHGNLRQASITGHLWTNEYGEGTISFNNPYHGSGYENLVGEKISKQEKIELSVTVNGHGKNKARKKAARAITLWSDSVQNYGENRRPALRKIGDKKRKRHKSKSSSFSPSTYKPW